MSKYYKVDVNISATVCVEADDIDEAMSKAESFAEEKCDFWQTQMDVYWVESVYNRTEEIDEDEYNEFMCQ